jgi:hypothetical protein
MQKVSPVLFSAKPFVRRAPIYHNRAKSPRVGGVLFMDSDAMNYGSHLRDYERNLAQIEKDREQLEEEILQRQMELVQLSGQKADCRLMLAVTKKLMKLPLTEDEKKYLPEGVARVISIPADAFKGMKLAEAAEGFLLRFGEPATHRQVIDGLREGGLDVQLKNLDNSLRSAMQRSGKFKWFKDAEGTYRWAILQWIQRAPREAVSQDSDEKRNLMVVGGSEAIAKSA